MLAIVDIEREGGGESCSGRDAEQGNYSLRRPPKLVIQQAVIGQRWATVYSNLYKQTVIHSKSAPLCVGPL